MPPENTLEQTIEALLADPDQQANPLLDALRQLYAAYLDQLYKLERITQISDKFQTTAQRETASLTKRFDKSLRQLERITQISDHYQRLLRELNTDLQHSSTHDQLTKIGNRKLILESMDAEIKRVDRGGEPFSLVLADIDHFKAVNDEHGHTVGDAVLVEVTQQLGALLREYDVLSRWGGEEFLILLPATRLPNALALAERLCQQIADLEIETDAGRVRVSASFGVTEYRPGETSHETIKRSDEALYEAKRQGRSRAVALD